MNLFFIFLFHLSYAQEDTIRGKILSGGKPVSNAVIDLYLGEDNLIDFTTTNEHGVFKFNFQKSDVKLEATPDIKEKIEISRVGNNKWKLSIKEDEISFFKEYWFIMGPILGFIAGSLYGLFFQIVTKFFKRLRFRKNDYYPLLNDIQNILNEIELYVLEKQPGKRFLGEIIKLYERKTNEICNEIKSIIDYNKGIKEYDNKSYRKLKSYSQSLSELNRFLTDPDRKHQRFFKEYHKNHDNAKRIDTELTSAIDNLVKIKQRSNIVKQIINKIIRLFTLQKSIAI